MKHATLALLLALTLVVGLGGCGRRDNTGGNNNDILGDNTTGNGGSIDNGANSGMNGSTNNGANGGMNGNTNNGTANGGTNSDTNNATNGTTNGTDGEGLLQGRSYQEMLEDGRVHDSDGYLHDGENSVSR